MKKRKIYPKEFKARVAYEALQEHKTIAQISSEYEVNANLVTKWKKQMKDGMADIFTRKNEREPSEKELIDKLYKQIGKSQVEIDWLKKKLGL
jgi:transposase-like protein